MSSPSRRPPSGTQIDARDLFDVAESLANTTRRASQSFPAGVVEAWARSTISRIYFAAFIHARNYVERTGGAHIPRNANSHALVVQALKSSPTPGGSAPGPRESTAGTALGNLRTLRNKADYEVPRRRINWVQQMQHAADVFALP